MVKLKIGSIKEKKEEKEESKEDYLNELSDEELETLQEEVEENEIKHLNGLEKSALQKVEEFNKEQEIETNIEEEAKEAVNGVSMLDKVGVHMDYVNKFNEKHPNRKTIYRGVITKSFLVWYIKNAKLSLLNKLDINDNEYVNQNHTPYLMQLIKTRLHEKVEIEEKETEIGIMLDTEEQIDTYEFLLNEKWKNRAKGILELDTLITEQMRVNQLDLTHALINLINIFKLQTKHAKHKDEKKLIDVIAPEKPKAKKEREYIQAKDIQKSVKYFHHIKFLYNLMSEKMDFIEEPTPEDIEKIETITNLIENRTELTPTTPKKKGKKGKKEPKNTPTMDNYFEEGN